MPEANKTQEQQLTHKHRETYAIAFMDDGSFGKVSVPDNCVRIVGLATGDDDIQQVYVPTNKISGNSMFKYELDNLLDCTFVNNKQRKAFDANLWRIIHSALGSSYDLENKYRFRDSEKLPMYDL